MISWPPGAIRPPPGTDPSTRLGREPAALHRAPFSEIEGQLQKPGEDRIGRIRGGAAAVFRAE